MNIENHDFYNFLSKLAKNIADLFGKNCETAICRPDIVDNHIVEIYNGHVTGRSVGDSMSILGIKQIEKQDFCTDWPSYTTKTSDGKIIKSFSLYTTIDGNPYVFGINFDCTDIANVLPAMSFIQDLISFNSQVEDDFISDHKTNSVEEINRAIKIVNKSPLLMNTNERKIVVNHLHENGFFEINGSAKLIAENLNISHHTVYKYLREIRKNNR